MPCAADRFGSNKSSVRVRFRSVALMNVRVTMTLLCKNINDANKCYSPSLLVHSAYPICMYLKSQPLDL